MTAETDVLAPMRSVFTTVGSVLVAAGIVVIAVWFVRTFWGRKRTTGTIVAVTRTYSGRGRSGMRSTIRYEAEGETCEIETQMMMGSHSEGEPVTVRYVPGMASDGIVATAFFALLGLFLALLGAMFVIVAATVRV